MKDSYRRVSVTRLCRLLGVTRQAFYQHFWFIEDLSIQEQLVLQQIGDIRKQHPAMGGRKLHYLLQPFLQEHQIKLGRDGLFDLMIDNGLLVRKRRRKVRTTNSSHQLRRYPNLIKEWHPSKPKQLWVADITYVPVKNGFLYLSLITDAYSHKIVGYNIADNMASVNTVKALDMALKHNSGIQDLIHHSDRGIQYCCYDYVAMLKKHQVKISMTESGDPLENALAERINGIMKHEYIKYVKIESVQKAEAMITDLIARYNHTRPHLSINMLTPAVVHELELPVNRRWNRINQMPNIVMQSLTKP
ncbi:MAG TPA: IS3 family transposase [Lacibacter sp.]|nr:IS3 family transposase [Lacibacter sp.]